jgi:molybdate transport system substrate-binding protein
VKGVDIVGPIPDAVQLKTIVAAGVGANTSRAREARMLIAELASPALDHAKRAAGLLPV